MIRPLVVHGPDGTTLTALTTNEKGLKKTVERGELWALHPETDRLLPVYPGISAVVTDHSGWFLAKLSKLPAGAPFEGAAPHGDSKSATRDLTGSTRRTDEVTRPAEHPHSGADASSIGSVLASLAAVVHTRRLEMPEGSYTTHLFSSGVDKIRKKFGEEAVELLLAREPDHLASETADLIYHLLVLLEAEGLSLNRIAAELERR